MYEELIKQMRSVYQEIDCLDCPLAKDCMKLQGVCAFTRAADAIEELTDTNVGKWIPVAERLPEPKQKVLVATYHGGVYYGYMEPRGKFYTANNTLADSWCWEPNVTHWMPLPEPPKEEA